MCRTLCAVLIAQLTLSLWGQGVSRPRTGRFSVVCKETNPLWTKKELRRRYSSKLTLTERDYKIGELSCTVDVPESYVSWQAHGLFVWLGDELPDGWGEVLHKQHLIVIAVDVLEARLTTGALPRVLDAYTSVTKLYNIDPERVYLGGHELGGQIASNLAVAFCDLFHGAVLDHGASFWDRIYINPNDREDHYEQALKPGTRFTATAKRSRRFALISGDTAPQLDEVRETFNQGYEKTFRKNAKFILVPKHPAGPAPAKTFKEALDFVEGLGQETAVDLFKKGRSSEQNGKYSKALTSYFRAMTRGHKAAGERITAIKAEITTETDKIKEAVKTQNWFVAYVLADFVVSKYGADAAANALRIKLRIEANKKVFTEVQAEIQLQQAKERMAKQKSKKKTRRILQSVIKDFPETAAAKEAKELLPLTK